MRRELQRQGFSETDPSQADLVLTHSGGIYLMPDTTRAELFIHLNCTTYMPFKVLIAAHHSKIAYDLRKRHAKRQWLRWLLAIAANAFYLCNIPRGLRMRKGFMESSKVMADLPSGHHVFIGGYGDGLSDPSAVLTSTLQHCTYVTIPDVGHDDCWREPELFMPTIQRFFEVTPRTQPAERVVQSYL